MKPMKGGIFFGGQNESRVSKTSKDSFGFVVFCNIMWMFFCELMEVPMDFWRFTPRIKLSILYILAIGYK